MPEEGDREALAKARADERSGKAPTTQAGEFIREEIHHIRKGKHGARSAEQAIAIGLSKARRAGVKLPPPAKGKTAAAVRRNALRDSARGRNGLRRKASARRSRATLGAMKREGRTAASQAALARHARSAAAKRNPVERSAAAMKAVRTKGPRKRSAAARKAARTRAREAR